MSSGWVPEGLLYRVDEERDFIEKFIERLGTSSPR